MSSIEEIYIELRRAEESIRRISERLQREQNEISHEISQVQGAFGGDGAGRQLISQLSDASYKVSAADDCLYSLRAQLERAAASVKK